MVALSNFADLVRTAIEEGIDVIFSGAGLPVNLPEFLKEGVRTKLVPIVSSGRAAALIARRWLDKYGYRPDAFVVEGPRAGGHLGFKREQLEDPKYSLEVLVPEVIEAAGSLRGRGDPDTGHRRGRGLHGGGHPGDARAGGREVQMATRFVATDECDADRAFKQSYVAAAEGDLEIIASPVGMPGRSGSQQVPRRRGSGPEDPVLLPLPLHRDLRSREGAVLHLPGLAERPEGAAGQGLRRRGGQRPEGGEHRAREPASGVPGGGVPGVREPGLNGPRQASETPGRTRAFGSRRPEPTACGVSYPRL
ncbi:MAG: nitronate monooxygenase [Bacillus subtilis]|nr:nitronate monooxygenase [Bacillus subtilis]